MTGWWLTYPNIQWDLSWVFMGLKKVIQWDINGIYTRPGKHDQKAIEHGHWNSGFTHEKWVDLSIVFCKRLPEGKMIEAPETWDKYDKSYRKKFWKCETIG